MTSAVRFLTIFYLVVLLAGAGGLFAVLTRLSPQNSAWFSLPLLYLSVFVIVFGFTAVFGVLVRYLFASRALVFKNNGTIARQSGWWGLLIIGALALQSTGLLNIFSALLMIAVIGILELYFLSR